MRAISEAADNPGTAWFVAGFRNEEDAASSSLRTDPTLSPFFIDAIISFLRQIVLRAKTCTAMAMTSPPRRFERCSSVSRRGVRDLPARVGIRCGVSGSDYFRLEHSLVCGSARSRIYRPGRIMAASGAGCRTLAALRRPTLT